MSKQEKLARTYDSLCIRWHHAAAVGLNKNRFVSLYVLQKELRAVTAELADRVPKRGGEKERKKAARIDVPFRGTYAYDLGEGPDWRTAPEIQKRTRAAAHAFGT